MAKSLLCQAANQFDGFRLEDWKRTHDLTREAANTSLCSGDVLEQFLRNYTASVMGVRNHLLAQTEFKSLPISIS